MEDKKEYTDSEDLIRKYLMPNAENGKFPFLILKERPEGMSFELYKTIQTLQTKRIKQWRKGEVFHESRYLVDKVNLKGEKKSKEVSSTYRKNASNND